MKTLKATAILVALTLFSAFQTIDPQETIAVGDFKLPKVENKAFKAGERLEYRLHYGFVDAGIAELKVEKLNKKINGREVYRMVGTGRSKGTFDWFFKVRDHYETYVDAEGLFPWMFVRRVNEGGYKFSQDYIFYQHQQKVKTQDNKEFEVPVGVQDMLSAFYYARNIDFSHAQKGDIFTITTFVDDEIWPLKIKYIGKDVVKVNGKKYRALKFHPVIQTGRIFKDEDDLNVWISDDNNKVPLLAEAKILVGSIKMELESYEGLTSPLAVVEKKE
jgi:hypothetical protein